MQTKNFKEAFTFRVERLRPVNKNLFKQKTGNITSL